MDLDELDLTSDLMPKQPTITEKEISDTPIHVEEEEEEEKFQDECIHIRNMLMPC